MSKNKARPVLISVAHYLDELEDGTATVFEIIETADRLGVDGVELRREPWAGWKNELEAARKEIEQRELMVTYATHITLFATNAGDEALLRQDIESAAVLGSPYLRVFQGPAPADSDEAGWQAGRAAVEYAASHGIVLALENYARTPGGRVAEIKGVLDRIPSPALATNIDIANYTNHDEDVVAAIQTVGEWAVYAHLKDKSPGSGDLTYLGGGSLPLSDILDALDRLPQRIIYCFEFRSGGEPEERIKKSLAYLQARRVKH